MAHEEKKFWYNLVFCEEHKNKVVEWHKYLEFSVADTAEGSVESLFRLLRGSTILKQRFAADSNVRLTKFELVGSGKTLFHFDVNMMGSVIDNIASLLVSGSMLGDPWKYLVFDNVNRELLDALVKTFPDQKHAFKGKLLEGELGL